MSLMQIYEIPCWSCGKFYKVAIIFDGFGGVYSAMNFNASEIAIARQNGVLVWERFSNTLKTVYMASCCGKCGAFCGDFFACFEVPHEYDEWLIKKIEISNLKSEV